MAHTYLLAWRNLGRNRRRTVITGAALAVGMSLCVVTFGIMDGMNADILQALTHLHLGHVQFHQPDYPRKHSLQLTLAHLPEIVAAAKSVKAVRGVSQRVYGFGLVSHQHKSVGIELCGVDPQIEPTVTNLDQYMIKGQYLPAQPTPWPAARSLSAAEKARDQQITRQAEQAALAEIEQLGTAEGAITDGEQPSTTPGGAQGDMQQKKSLDESTHSWSTRLANQLEPPPRRPPTIIIGATLAKILQARIGDQLYLMTQTADGLNAETFFKVIGIFKTGTERYDRNRIYLHLKDLQRFLHLSGRAHEVTLRLGSAKAAPSVAAQLQRRLKLRGVLVRSWDEIRPDIKSILQLNQVSTGLMVFIIFIVAALGVVNTMLMAVFERTRELGMLKAIGMSGRRIIGLIVTETLLLVLMASVVGVAIGLAFDGYFYFSGMDLSALTGGISVGGMGVPPVIHTVITLEGVLVPMVILSSICFLAAFYPAWRAARLRPAQGMREV